MEAIANALSVFPKSLLLKLNVYPERIDGKYVHVLMEDPSDLTAIELLEFAGNMDVVPKKEAKEKIRGLLSDLSSKQDDLGAMAFTLTEQLKKSYEDPSAFATSEDLKKSSLSEPVVKVVDLIINEAIKAGASDIHVEPQEDSVVVRNRVDGLLSKSADFPKWLGLPITSRIKILADLDIAEKRVPQDGRIKREFQGVNIDLRVSTLPTHFGEKTVIRILRHTADLFSLDNLGFSADEITYIHDLINRPQGIIFVTGPTGSGKSSSLFAFLNKIREKHINITTIENPIEIKLPGINQVQVNEKAGLTFANILRSILRQDPDVILIGEIRDRETAEIAVQAAQTGHLVFSTLHTNDAASSLTRLKDLGVPPFLIASAIISIVAQRLVRRLCRHCQMPYVPTDEIVFKYKHIFRDIPMPASFASKGCNKCNNTGFEGRIGVFEFLKLDMDIRQMIIDEKNDLDIKAVVVKKGMKTLAVNALEKVSQGVTSLEELLRVVAE